MCIFFFNDTATTEIYTLSLHDALPIYVASVVSRMNVDIDALYRYAWTRQRPWSSSLKTNVNAGYGNVVDRKSTRLNSSHLVISYAVFCLKKKKTSDLQPQ